MIGLEALYLPDGNQELSFRLSLRMAYTLETNPKERKALYTFIKNLYDIRSRIVHGDTYRLNVNEINKLNDLLRNSLKLWINDRNNFSIDKYSKSGNLTMEGTLNNLFYTST